MYTIFCLNVDTDECIDSPCGKNGVCQNFAGGYRCGCVDGWDGEDCDEGEIYLIPV